MKFKRLILEEDSSTESRRATLRERLMQEAGPAERTAKEKEKPMGKKLHIIEERSTPVESPQASQRDKGKAVQIEEVPLTRNEIPVERIRMKVPQERAAEVLPLLQYLDRKREKYAKGRAYESYVEIVHNRTQIKMAVAVEVAAKERRSQPTEAKYQALQKRLIEEVEKRRKAKQEKEQEYQIELAVRAKKLTEYEAARFSDLEIIEKLEVQCCELKTQRLQVGEQLCEVEAKLMEAEGKNRQLSEETRDALTVRMKRCLRGYVLWQIESHNGLRLREIEHRVAKLIVRSGRMHRHLSKKLESYLTRSRDTVANLEVELASFLRILGLERRLEEAETADSANVGTVRCSHRSE
ncbi:hypothetical protein AXG93_3991s1000 [Marchantia polymorpha subsp. ruderalis]|uniref:Uncharacterized protein n=1 Tax=Marchantia polymorpha subsp. ruderalis TaxID=1480154 RepID=A0A176WEI5_MARPO|nr:hypothetical protein AXG93_3991s1000 [Marchantia polymorpha subsp. ruderalis]